MARWLGRLLLPVVVGVLAMTALAAPAFAHGQLAMSTPVKDSTVREPMEFLSLYFTEAPAPNAYFAVTAPSGARVDRPWTHGQPKRLDKPVQEYNLVDGVWEPSVYNTGFPAEIPVAYWPERGEYVVRYLSIASDGEPVQGELRFTYKGKTSGPPKGWQAPDNEPDSSLLASAEPGSGTQAPVPEAGGSPAPGTQAGGSPAPVTQTGGSPAAMGPAVPQAGAAAVPETGGSQGAVPETGTAGTAAGNAQPADSGTGLSVWLVPAVLIVGAGVLVVRAARRPAPTTTAARRPSGRPQAKTPSRAPASRTPQRPKSAKRR
ncbi:copper resistance protein CopC [Microbispora sp. NEAU-D428]|uniref:copper resistance protein CopC n=1 Tax=Microbispora sitophila TaxID=2771537 RepID=UPI001868C9F2|nr:copper resistance protein CopC [Microbispora sitophila]MBE3015844.1 copper resistance protein CopC [Microbispora sitophila]